MLKGKPKAAGRLGRDVAERIAVAALGFLAADGERLSRFLNVTGLAPDEIRAAAAEPGFLPAVLDHVAGDDALVLGLAAALEIGPEDVMEARRALSPDATS